ncbi:MAG: MoaD/ThiS family protein [Wenzhouxiangellaceae bacterium]|nr:MoaD/ThiS family protein [Wenzhouxiangellaceae bacterium]
MQQATSPTKIRIELPEALRPLADGAACVNGRGFTVAEVLTDIGHSHPPLVNRILTRGGGLRPHVKLFVNQSDIRQRDGLETRLVESDVLLVVPSVAGG